jgi:hypothetical protein
MVKHGPCNVHYSVHYSAMYMLLLDAQRTQHMYVTACLE